MRELIDGSTAIVRGALAAGCDFFAGYPITPASSILMMMMEELPRRGGVAVQGEDEIASIGMCLGATLAGARAMTATSGPGISLYSENIGLAVIGEVPLVIVDVQRLGPATGGATTPGQGDVLFVRWGTAGGYPVIALAPSSIPECYELTLRAFDLAERFRCPVFLLTDKELSLTANTVDLSAWKPVPVRSRPHLAGGERGGEGRLRPYRYEPADGVPPLFSYGDGKVRFTGSTHDESAVITKDPAIVGALNRHLVAKIDAHAEELEWVREDFEPDAEVLLISYGTTARAMREALRRARSAGLKVSGLTLLSLWPVPEKALRRALSRMRRAVVAELNPGLYRREVERVARQTPGVEIAGLHRIDGELIAPEDFLEVIQ